MQVCKEKREGDEPVSVEAIAKKKVPGSFLLKLYFFALKIKSNFQNQILSGVALKLLVIFLTFYRAKKKVLGYFFITDFSFFK